MLLLACLLPMVASPARAAVLKPAGWTASSVSAPSEARTFDVAHLGDGKQSTAWVEGDDGGGLGAWVVADLGGERVLTGMTIWPGNWYSFEYWQHFNRPKVVELEFSDGSSQEFTLRDAFEPQALTFSRPKTTGTVRIKIKGIYTGKGVDTAISEVVFHDAGKGEHAPVRAAAASSVFPPDADGDYAPDNLYDGIVDSMWCEGNKASDGSGEWIELDFGGPQTVSQLKLRNGSGYSPALYLKSNRVTAATLAFSDGRTEPVAIKDIYFEQTIRFPAHTTDKVRITVSGVKKGSEYDDLCLSELYFLP